MRRALATGPFRPESVSATNRQLVLGSVMSVLRVKKISEFALLPARGSAGAAGYDLSSAYDCTIPPRGKALCKTDLEMAIPDGHYGRIGARATPRAHATGRVRPCPSQATGAGFAQLCAHARFPLRALLIVQPHGQALRGSTSSMLAPA